jgi:hypothetical protein
MIIGYLACRCRPLPTVSEIAKESTCSKISHIAQSRAADA